MSMIFLTDHCPVITNHSFTYFWYCDTNSAVCDRNGSQKQAAHMTRQHIWRIQAPLNQRDMYLQDLILSYRVLVTKAFMQTCTQTGCNRSGKEEKIHLHLRRYLIHVPHFSTLNSCEFFVFLQTCYYNKNSPDNCLGRWQQTLRGVELSSGLLVLIY